MFGGFLWFDFWGSLGFVAGWSRARGRGWGACWALQGCCSHLENNKNHKKPGTERTEPPKSRPGSSLRAPGSFFIEGGLSWWPQPHLEGLPGPARPRPTSMSHQGGGSTQAVGMCEHSSTTLDGDRMEGHHPTGLHGGGSHLSTSLGQHPGAGGGAGRWLCHH